MPTFFGSCDCIAVRDPCADIFALLHIQFLPHSSVNSWDFLSVGNDQGIFSLLMKVAFGPHPRVEAVCQEK